MRIIKGQEIEQFIINPCDFFRKLESYDGTGRKNVRNFLDSVLDAEEKEMLVNLLYNKDGWYCKVGGSGFYRVKLLARSLNFTNGMMFLDESEKENYGRAFKTQVEFDIGRSVYLKQKIITRKNMLNNGCESSILLYRGIKENDLKRYYLGNVESWTTDEDVARRLAGHQGTVFSKVFNIDDIWTMHKTSYSQYDCPETTVKIMLKRENEFIIENQDEYIILR